MSVNNHKDDLLLRCIRRANLDTFWSRATSTVANNIRLVEKQIKLSATVGLDGPFEQWGVLPNHYHCGYEVAINMLLYSMQKGRYNDEYVQFDTIRKLRSAYSNHVRAYVQGNQTTISIQDHNGKY